MRLYDLLEAVERKKSPRYAVDVKEKKRSHFKDKKDCKKDKEIVEPYQWYFEVESQKIGKIERKNRYHHIVDEKKKRSFFYSRGDDILIQCFDILDSLLDNDFTLILL